MLKVVILALVGLSQAFHPGHPKLNRVKRKSTEWHELFENEKIIRNNHCFKFL